MRQSDEDLIRELEELIRDMENVAVQFRTSLPGLSMRSFMTAQTAKRAAERIRELSGEKEG